MTNHVSKSSFALCVVLLFSTMSFAQSIAPQSVNSTGLIGTQANGSLSFTVGELVVLSQTDIEGNSLGGGFTAGATLTTVSVQETDVTVLDVKVFPNPISELVNIQVNHAAIHYFRVEIVDLHGKVVYNGNYAGLTNVIGINTTSFTPGVYMLSLKNTSNNVLGTYKIIKH